MIVSNYMVINKFTVSPSRLVLSTGGAAVRGVRRRTFRVPDPLRPPTVPVLQPLFNRLVLLRTDHVMRVSPRLLVVRDVIAVVELAARLVDFRIRVFPGVVVGFRSFVPVGTWRRCAAFLVRVEGAVGRSRFARVFRRLVLWKPVDLGLLRLHVHLVSLLARVVRLVRAHVTWQLQLFRLIRSVEVAGAGRPSRLVLAFDLVVLGGAGRRRRFNLGLALQGGAKRGLLVEVGAAVSCVVVALRCSE